MNHEYISDVNLTKEYEEDQVLIFNPITLNSEADFHGKLEEVTNFDDYLTQCYICNPIIETSSDLACSSYLGDELTKQIESASLNSNPIQLF